MPKPAEQMGPPKSGNSKCQILDSRAWAPELPNLLNSWDPQKLETPEASKQLCFFWVAVYKGSSFPLLLGGGSPQYIYIYAHPSMGNYGAAMYNQEI